MQSEKTTVKTTETAAPAHDAEPSADEVAKRLSDLGNEPEQAPEEPKAETPEAEPEPQADEKQEPETEPEAEPEPADEPGDAPAASIPKERLDREIEKRRKATERAEALETETSALKAKLDAQAAEVAERLALHPAFVPEAERKLILRANELEAEKARLIEHWDGIENDDPKQAMTAADVRRQYARADSELSRISGQADAAYRNAKAEMLEALKIGRQVLMERKASGLKKPPRPPVKAQAPVKASSPAARPVGTPGQRKPDILTIFREKGGDAQAAEAALANL